MIVTSTLDAPTQEDHFSAVVVRDIKEMGQLAPYKVRDRVFTPLSHLHCTSPYSIAVIAVDGSWSVWSSWSMCSVTCGQIGRRISTRTCDNPVPENGGNPCSVDGSADTKLEDCNVTGNPCFLFACDFDHTCNYGELPSSDVEDCFFNVVDNLEDNQNWHMREGPTLTWGTGPSADHTTGVGSYAYFEASHSADNYKRPGQNALLVSPTIGPVLADRHPCIEFYYHMYSMDTDLSAMGKLNVLLKTYERSSEGRLWKLEETVWTRSGNQGSEWLLGAVQVPINVPFQVIFEAVRGESTSGQSDIAIDDIKVGVNCSGLPLNHCSHPGIPRNAETYNSPHGLVLPAGSQIHFRCVAGYFVSSGGSLVRTCVNGHWTGTQITCYRANCRGLTEGEQVLDACERLCHCVHNQLTDCHRIRKEITVMPLSERERYVKTLKNLSRTQAYQDLIGIHSLIYEEGIHNKLYFLPWHRYYLLALENHLRQLDCRVTVPYWDWSAVASNPFQSPLWRGDSYHFGSAEGHREDNYCIRNGPFEKGQWFWVDRDRGYLPSNWYCLKRQADLAATFYNKIQVADVLQKARVYNSKHDLEFRFTQFEEELRINMHMGVHCAILGDMCTYEAANAPEFFLHHGMVDLIWLRYQSLSSAHQTVYYMDNTAPMTSSDGRSLTGPFNVSVTDFLFITDLPRMGSSEPGPLSVKYQAMYPILDEALHSLNLTELEAVCSGPPSYLRDSTWLAFSVSQEERAAAMELMERMQKTTNGTCELEEVLKHHIHDQLGFDVGKVVNLLHHHGRIGRRSVNSLRQRYVLGRNSKE